MNMDRIVGSGFPVEEKKIFADWIVVCVRCVCRSAYAYAYCICRMRMQYLLNIFSVLFTLAMHEKRTLHIIIIESYELWYST